MTQPINGRNSVAELSQAELKNADGGSVGADASMLIVQECSSKVSEHTEEALSRPYKLATTSKPTLGAASVKVTLRSMAETKMIEVTFAPLPRVNDVVDVSQERPCSSKSKPSKTEIFITTFQMKLGVVTGNIGKVKKNQS